VISPRRIRVKFNLGFSSLLGLGELKSMDSDGDGVIRPPEQEAYLARLEARVLPQVELHLDGKPLPLRVTSRRGLGILGPIEEVGFDTYFEAEAECALGPGPHELRYLDGTYQGEVSKQLIWIPIRPREMSFETRQAQQIAPIDQRGVRKLFGRDVSVRFEFTPEGLADDAVLALLEPNLAALEGSATLLETSLADALGEELNAMSFGGVRFGSRAAATAFTQGAPMANDRVLKESQAGAQAVSVEPASIPDPDASPREQSETAEMVALYRQPFSFWALLVFMLWGAGHALMPGHGKSMVAAYLLGTEGRISDAFKLGGIVTITHTIALYTVGLGIVYLVSESDWSRVLSMTSQRLMLLSGVGLVGYGLWMGFDRWRHFRAMGVLGAAEERLQGSAAHPADAPHDHAHEHPADAPHDHAHEHTAAAPHEHAHEHTADAPHDHAHEHTAAAPHDHTADAPHDHAHEHTAAAPHDHAHEHTAAAPHDHAHEHTADAPHDHAHEHTAAAPHNHAHEHTADAPHDHEHAGGHAHDHAHMTDEEHALAHARDAASVTSFRDLLVLGVTGGLVPCPAGVTLVILSLSFKGENTLKCFVYLSAFSLGLAGVLVAIATSMVLTQRFVVPDGEKGTRMRRVIDFLPVVSCLAIVAVGLWFTLQAFFPELSSAQQEALGGL